MRERERRRRIVNRYIFMGAESHSGWEPRARHRLITLARFSSFGALSAASSSSTSSLSSAQRLGDSAYPLSTLSERSFTAATFETRWRLSYVRRLIAFRERVLIRLCACVVCAHRVAPFAKAAASLFYEYGNCCLCYGDGDAL